MRELHFRITVPNTFTFHVAKKEASQPAAAAAAAAAAAPSPVQQLLGKTVLKLGIQTVAPLFQYCLAFLNWWIDAV